MTERASDAGDDYFSSRDSIAIALDAKFDEVIKIAGECRY